MIKKLTILALGLVLVFNAKSQTVLDIELKDLNGNYTSINQINSSNLIVIDFWATYCKPCLKSIPKLVELSEKYSANGVSFVGINEDSPRNTNKVKPLASKLKISYPTLLDTEQEIMSDLLVGVLPTLIILNKKAEVLYTHEGYIPGDEKVIENELNKLLQDYE